MSLMVRRGATLVLVGVFVFGTGCDHGHGGHEHPEASSAPADHSDESHSEGHGGSHSEGQGEGLQLTLDHGAKWQMDEPTRESATKLASLVAETELLQSVEEGRALGQALDEELDTLVRRCKMTGPAHDQLHVFLIALFPQVEALLEGTRVDDLQLARREIDDLFVAYEQHFE